MRILLASLTLLPVIASLQLPPFSVNLHPNSHHLPLRPRQYTQKDLETAQNDSEVTEEDSKTQLGYLAPDSPLGDLLPGEYETGSDMLFSAPSRDGSPCRDTQQRHRGPSNGQDSSPSPQGSDWRYANINQLYSVLSDPRFEALAEAVRAGDSDSSARSPDDLKQRGKKRSGSSLRYIMPSAYVVARSSPSFHQPLFTRRLNLAHLDLKPSSSLRSYDFPPSSSSQQPGFEAFLQDLSEAQQQQLLRLDGARRTPSKRYLGIELPDYIASNYPGDRSGKAKLHNLKQLMRNAGK